jgi:hypothetical protein
MSPLSALPRALTPAERVQGLLGGGRGCRVGYRQLGRDAHRADRADGHRPDVRVRAQSPCPRSAGVKARGSAEKGQDRARGSARTRRIGREGARFEGTRSDALTGRMALGARARQGWRVEG